MMHHQRQHGEAVHAMRRAHRRHPDVIPEQRLLRPQVNKLQENWWQDTRCKGKN